MLVQYEYSVLIKADLPNEVLDSYIRSTRKLKFEQCLYSV